MILLIVPVVPIGWSTYVSGAKILQELNYTEKRLEGINYTLYLDQLLRAVQVRREFSTAYLLSKQSDLLERSNHAAENIRSLVDSIDKNGRNAAIRFKVLESWEKNKKELLDLAGAISSDPSINYARHTAAVDHIGNLINHVNIRSELLSGSKGVENYMLLSGVKNIPVLADQVGRLGYIAGRIQQSRVLTPDDSRQMNVLETHMEQYYLTLTDSINAIEDLDPEFARLIRPPYRSTMIQFNRYRAKLENSLQSVNFSVDTDFSIESARTVEQLYQFQSIVIDMSRYLMQKQLRGYYNSFYILAAVSIGIGMIAFIFAFLLALSINKPIENALDLTSAMSSGDFTLKAKIHGDDEMAHFLSAINAMSTNLSQMIVGIYDTARQTADSAVELSTASETFRSTAEEQAESVLNAKNSIRMISVSTEKTSGSITNAAESLEVINSNLQDLNATADQVNQTMNDLNNLALRTSEKAEVSEHQIKEATEAMKKIEESSSRITEFTTIITGISDQTNLLSLNASIEAARAGDAGRGFAVVAEEISKLADQTINSVKEVTNLINATMEAVRNGSERVGTAAGNIQNIIKEIKQIGEYTSQVMNIFETQSNNTRSISGRSGSLTEIYSSIISSADGQRAASIEIEKIMEELSNGAENVSNNTNNLARMATSLKGWSEYMLKMVDVFKV